MESRHHRYLPHPPKQPGSRTSATGYSSSAQIRGPNLHPHSSGHVHVSSSNRQDREGKKRDRLVGFIQLETTFTLGGDQHLAAEELSSDQSSVFDPNVQPP